jgi:sugar lactone lactonase YvrE
METSMMRPLRRLFASSAVLLIGSSILVGCSMAPIANQPSTSPVSGPAALTSTPFHGVVHGGQSPIVGAQIYMLSVTVRTASPYYGQQSTSLMNDKPPDTSNADGVNRWYYVTTNATGGFTIASGDYSCNSGDEVYLYSLGGNAGSGSNAGAGLMAVLGTCGSANSIAGLPATIQMNEVTTVAAAYALAGFATDATHISRSNTSLAATGMKNAALNTANLTDLGTGLALATTPSGTGTVPQDQIYTLADILAACINSVDPSTIGCTTLFQTATSNGTTSGTQPGDTASAAINIAHNPGSNVATLFALATPTAPFQPDDSEPPNDWTIGIGYSGGSLSNPTGLAIDASGNAWVIDTPGNGQNSVSVVGPQGSFLAFETSGSCGNVFLHPSAIALSPSTVSPATAWVADNYKQTVTAFDGNCAAVDPPAGDYCTAGTLPYCNPTAVAAGSDLRIVDDGKPGVYGFTTSSSYVFLTTTGFGSPWAAAIDGTGQTWITDVGNSGLMPPVPATLFVLSSDGSTLTAADNTAPFTDNGDSMALGLNTSVWVTDLQGDSLYLFTTSGTTATLADTIASPSGGLYNPVSVAVDGAGNAWVANSGGSNVSEFSSSGTAISPDGISMVSNGGYTGAGQLTVGSTPTGVAIDPSGDVWVTTQSGGDPLIEIIGAAAPTVTPLADASVGNKIATRP